MTQQGFLELPIRREVTFRYRNENRVGWVEIISISQEADLVKCTLGIKLDICRETSVYGVDTMQALQAGLAVIGAHLDRIEANWKDPNTSQ